MIVRCTYCGCEFDPSAGWRLVTGWERKASSASRRGGSDVVLRTPRGEKFACDPCIDNLKHGRSAYQEALL